ncbi:MAG: hypothetical protein N2651_08625 [Fimbriimonadales bacterium]|nr:hypothetical protein [Fimbriimonadales bacterium]
MQRNLFWGWLCLLLCTASAQSEADPMQQVVSFREPAQRVEQVLKTLSQRGGVTLLAAPEVKHEIVLIDAEALTLRQLMDGLADALDAEWRKQPDGAYRLRRTANLAQRRQAVEGAYAAQKLRERLADLTPRNIDNTLTEAELRSFFRAARERLEAALDVDTKSRDAILNWRDFRRPMYDISPIERLLFRLLQQMDWAEISRIPEGECRFYSNQRGAFLLPFHKDPEPLLQQFLAEIVLVYTFYHDSVEGIHEIVQQYHQRGYDPLWDMLPVKRWMRITNPVLYLCVRRESEWQFMIFLQVYDAGATSPAAYDGAIINLDIPEETLETRRDLNWRKFPVEWSELGQLQWQALCKEILPEQLKRIDPARVEPLSLVATDLLRAYARALRKPLIALLHDKAADPRLARGEPYQAFHFCQSPVLLGDWQPYLAQWEWTDGDYLIAKPRFASQWWNRRYQRDQAASLIEGARRRGYESAEDALRAAQLAPDASTLASAGWWLRMNGVRISYLDFLTARLMNALGAQARQRLLMGHTVAVGELSAMAIQELNHQILAQWEWATLYAPDGSVLSRYGVFPVYCYPDGVPLSMQVRLQQETTVGFFCKRRNGVWSWFTELTRPHYFALTVPQDAEQENDYSKGERALYNPERAQYAIRTNFSFELVPFDANAVRLEFGGLNHYTPLGRPTRWDMPPEFAKPAFEAAREEAKAQLEMVRWLYKQYDR